MAAGFEFFSHESPGAPVLTGSAGKLAAVLDWALTGKGGWDTAFTGTNVRVYRAQAGNRFYLRLDDTQSIYSRLRAYRAMTAVSTGTNQFPNNTQAANINTWGVRKAQVASTTQAARYWGVRTNRYFVLFIETTDGSAYYRCFIQFGDFPSLCEADSHNTSLICAPYVDSNYYQSLTEISYEGLRPNTAYNTAPCYSAMSGTPNGAITSPLCGLHSPFKGSQAAYVPSLALSGRLHFGPLALGCTNSTTVNNGAFPRGRFPNVSMLYGPASNAADPQLPCQDLVPFSVGSREFLPLMTYTAVAGSHYQVDTYLLEMTDTDGAL